MPNQGIAFVTTQIGSDASPNSIELKRLFCRVFGFRLDTNGEIAKRCLRGKRSVGRFRKYHTVYLRKSEPQALTKELELYPKLHLLLYLRFNTINGLEIGEKWLENRLFNTRLALVYAYYRKRKLKTALKQMSARHAEASEQVQSSVIDFGDNDSTMCYKLCRLLANLNADVIASTSAMTDKYHNIAQLIEKYANTSERTAVLYDIELWRLFFPFIKCYNKAIKKSRRNS